MGWKWTSALSARLRTIRDMRLPQKPLKSRTANIVFYAIGTVLLWTTLAALGWILPGEKARHPFPIIILETGLISVLMLAIALAGFHGLLSPKEPTWPVADSDDLRVLADLTTRRVESSEKLVISWMTILVAAHVALLSFAGWVFNQPDLSRAKLGSVLLASAFTALCVLGFACFVEILRAEILAQDAVRFIRKVSGASPIGTFFTVVHSGGRQRVGNSLLQLGVYILACAWGFVALLLWITASIRNW